MSFRMKTDAKLPGPCGTMLKRDIFKDPAALYLKHTTRVPPIVIDGNLVAAAALFINLEYYNKI